VHFGGPPNCLNLNCWSIEKHAGHLAGCNSLTDERRKSALGRIHGELLKLGFEVAYSIVAKYMVKRRGPPSQRWRTFLR
jgi:hypothetical protein